MSILPGIFHGSKQKEELVLVFNIGASSVGGALFYKRKSGIPKIIFSAREAVPIEDKIDIDRFLFLTLQALDTVAGKIFMAGRGAPAKIFCVLSSPWYISQTRFIKLAKNAPFVFTQKLADELIQKEINLFQEEHKKEFINFESSIRTIELKNTKTMLNGYEVIAPLNQKAEEIEMTIFISMSGEGVLKKIEDTIAKHFHFSQIKFSSFVMASFATVRDMYPAEESFLLVDIGGEVTDISMIKKNTLRESISFPLGRNFLTRGVARSLGSSLGESASLISLFKDGHADEAVSKKIGPAIEILKSEWLNKFQESLANLSNDISIPATIYIAIDKDIADFFSETIRTEQFNQYTLTESKFKIIFLGTEVFHGAAEFEENVIREPFLIIDSIYINNFLN